jgi:non-homologous end joining protein Ku
MAATVFVVDATLLARAVSFDSCEEPAVSKYHAILDVLKNYVVYNMLTPKRKKDELAFVHSGYSGTVGGGADPPLDQLNTASAKMLKTLQGLKDLDVGNVSGFALVDSIIRACEMIQERASERPCTGTKIVVVTDGRGPCTAAPDGPGMVQLGESVACAIQALSCSFEFLLMDCGDDLLSSEAKPEAGVAEANGIKLESGEGAGAGQVLGTFRSNNWASRVHVIDSWQSLNCSLPHRVDFSRPRMGTTKVNGALYITPSLKIDVKTYAKVQVEANLPTASKLSRFATDESSMGKVESTPVFKCVDNPDEEVPREHVGDSFPYGGTLVPVNSDDKKKLKMETEAGIHVLGFYSHTEIPPQVVLAGTVDVVVPPRGNHRAQQALRAFQTALRNRKYVAMVRYVKKKDNDPVLGVLKPSFADPEDNFLYLCTLPFEQDVRRFKFDPLPASSLTPEEKAAALGIVDALSLEQGRPGRSVPHAPEHVYNPVTEHFRSCLADRALLGRDCELPDKMPPRLAEAYRANKAMLEKSAEQLNKFASTFQVEERTSVKRGWGTLKGGKEKDPGPYRKNPRILDEKAKLKNQFGLTGTQAGAGGGQPAETSRRDVEDSLFAPSNKPNNASELFGVSSEKAQAKTDQPETVMLDDDDDDDDELE